VNWLGEFADGTITDVGPGRSFAGVVAISVDGYRVAVPYGARVQRLERVSTGKHTWRVGIIAIDDDLHIVHEGGGHVIRQHGWGTDVLTGRPSAD
jgi:hypothetical protein